VGVGDGAADVVAVALGELDEVAGAEVLAVVEGTAADVALELSDDGELLLQAASMRPAATAVTAKATLRSASLLRDAMTNSYAPSGYSILLESGFGLRENNATANHPFNKVGSHRHRAGNNRQNNSHEERDQLNGADGPDVGFVHRGTQHSAQR
jgi:hypothetical protein